MPESLLGLDFFWDDEAVVFLDEDDDGAKLSELKF